MIALNVITCIALLFQLPTTGNHAGSDKQNITIQISVTLLCILILTMKQQRD